LGIPIHFRRLKNGDWTGSGPVREKMVGWIGNLLSYANHLVLINSVLTSLPMFMLYCLEITKRVCKRLDFFRSIFFWESDRHKRKYRLTKWNIICRTKDHIELGIEVLEIKNKCLLIKWMYKLLNENGVWEELLQNKYLPSHTLSQVKVKPSNSPFWKGLMRFKDDFFYLEVHLRLVTT
jgi:hypothetical protein